MGGSASREDPPILAAREGDLRVLPRPATVNRKSKNREDSDHFRKRMLRGSTSKKRDALASESAKEKTA